MRYDKQYQKYKIRNSLSQSSVTPPRGGEASTRKAVPAQGMIPKS